MKKNFFKTLAIVLVLIPSIFVFVACGETGLKPISTPIVTINTEGLASWNSIDNATEYIYVVDDGQEVSTTETSVLLTIGQEIKVKAKGDGVNCSDSSWSETKKYTLTLPAPELSVDQYGVVRWEAIQNATGYSYIIDGGTKQDTTETSITIQDEQTIKVMAIGDGEDYLDSNWSNEITFNFLQELVPPVLSIDAYGNVSWNPVDNASGYLCVINGETEIQISTTSYTLQSGQTLKVKALGDNENFRDSEFSLTITHKIQLATPTVTINSSTGVATWTAVANATHYGYKINGGTEITTTSTSVTLYDGQSIQVKAYGNNSYKESGWSVSKTYTKPITVSWPSTSTFKKFGFSSGLSQPAGTTLKSVNIYSNNMDIVLNGNSSAYETLKSKIKSAGFSETWSYTNSVTYYKGQLTSDYYTCGISYSSYGVITIQLSYN